MRSRVRFPLPYLCFHSQQQNSEFQEQKQQTSYSDFRREGDRMEAKGGGGEVRRVHIIYFLSRMGKIEHPHLIRVNHVNRAGVHLKDVRRWLSDLRGKEMPYSFSWSYKRRYKTGYVWQDLMDDDLITPISDNEYVLKGSEISAFTFGPNATVEKTDSIEKPAPVEEKTVQCDGGKDADVSGKQSEKKEPLKRTIILKMEGGGEEEEDVVNVLESEPAKEQLKGRVSDSSFSSFGDSDHDVLKKTKKDEKSGRNSTTWSSTTKTRSSSRVFRNLLACGAVDTKDSAMRPINRWSKATATKTETKGEICRADSVGGSQRVFGGAWNQQQQLPHSARKSFDGTKSSMKNTFVSQKQVSAASKPVAEPNCSQCGKAFKPEKLHAHMKSCRALKSRGRKGGPIALKLSHITAAKDE